MQLRNRFASAHFRVGLFSQLVGVAVRRLSALVLVGATAFVMETPALATDFRGITPTKSDKAAVKAKLGKPTLELEDRLEFSDKNGKEVVFFYTAADTAQLNLSPELAGKVLTIYFYPAKRAKYDLKALAHKGIVVGHGVTDQAELMTSYDDGENGISYHFIKDDPRIWRIVYYAPRAEFAKYQLPEKPAQQ
jgi:hypothetical protein